MFERKCGADLTLFSTVPKSLGVELSFSTGAKLTWCRIVFFNGWRTVLFRYSLHILHWGHYSRFISSYHLINGFCQDSWHIGIDRDWRECKDQQLWVEIVDEREIGRQFSHSWAFMAMSVSYYWAQYNHWTV